MRLDYATSELCHVYLFGAHVGTIVRQDNGYAAICGDEYLGVYPRQFEAVAAVKRASF